MQAVEPSTRAALICGVQAVVLAAAAGALSLATDLPFLFPAYGATAFILVWAPGVPAARWRSVVLGHALGASVGWASARCFGLDFDLATLLHQGSLAHVGAAAIALGVTTAGMMLLRAPHPPAGATTLIFALGSIQSPSNIAVVVSSVGALSLLAHAVRRAFAGPAPV